MMETKKRRIWPYVLLGFVILFGYVSYAAYTFINNIRQHPAKLLETDFVQNIIKKKVGEQNAGLFAFAPYVLGLEKPRTFLILFLNDTEIRPGGGFIGAYATIKMDGGKVEVLKVEGTEIIDKASDKEKLLDPPKILKDQLKVTKWFLRDSNWSPDFAVNAERALDFYARENGAANQEIDTVVGITTHVLESLLKKTGSLTVEGITFNAENVVETLEHEVEYGYADGGTPFAERKKILEPLMHAILGRVANDIFKSPDVYFDMVKTLGNEKDILMYSRDPEFQKLVEASNFDGRIVETKGDYLMWVDANLAALKTDHAIERSLTRTFVPQDEGSYIGSATMKYVHKGTFDWRTTRYRTYARVFVPKGSYITSLNISDSDGTGDVLSHDQIDQGEEGGYAWFGAFAVIEPSHTKEVSFIYNVSEEVRKQIQAGSYTLFVQKQAGTGAPRLTLGLDFGKTITSATPAEVSEKWGDAVYSIETDLTIDREFSVKF